MGQAFLEPNSTISNTTYTVVGAATADAAIAGTTRQPTVPPSSPRVSSIVQTDTFEVGIQGVPGDFASEAAATLWVWSNFIATGELHCRIKKNGVQIGDVIVCVDDLSGQLGWSHVDITGLVHGGAISLQFYANVADYTSNVIREAYVDLSYNVIGGGGGTLSGVIGSPVIHGSTVR
jgi:hypothetical protein